MEDLRILFDTAGDTGYHAQLADARGIEGAPKQWGRRRYNALFTAMDNLAFLTKLLDGPEPRRLTFATQDPALLRLPWELHNAEGTVHDGLFCDLADVTMGTALVTVNGEGASFTTLHLHMSYFLAVVKCRLGAHARVVRRECGNIGEVKATRYP